MASEETWNYVAPVFKPYEFAHAFDGVTEAEARAGMKDETLLALYEFRLYLQSPIMVLSGFARKGHKAGSDHYTGKAADVWMKGIHTVDQFFNMYLEVERWSSFTSIGVYPAWKIRKPDGVVFPAPGFHLSVRHDVHRGRRWSRYADKKYAALDYVFWKNVFTKGLTCNES